MASATWENPMRELTWNDFAGATGSVYEVASGETRIDLTLDRAEQLPVVDRAGSAFRLEFLGPVDPVLPQAIYPFRLGDDAFEMFIVPIARDQEGTRYEAIFTTVPPA
jgi:hypothetical protein